MNIPKKMLDENVALPLWPEVGKVLNLRRGATYKAAKNGEIETIRIGHVYRVSTAWLKRKLGMIESGDAA